MLYFVFVILYHTIQNSDIPAGWIILNSKASIIVVGKKPAYRDAGCFSCLSASANVLAGIYPG